MARRARRANADSSIRSRIILVGANPAAVVYISYRGKEQRVFPEVSSIQGFRFLAYRRLRRPIDPREIDVDALSDFPWMKEEEEKKGGLVI